MLILLMNESNNILVIKPSNECEICKKENITQINILPGYNEIKNEVWGELKVKIGGSITTHLEDKTLKEKFDGESFHKIKDDSLTEVIENTFNIGLLKQWKMNEKRPAIAYKIDERIKKLDELKF